MTEWGEGYVTSVGYTYNYYAEFNPVRMVFPLLYAGIRVPEITTACELGFGQGISLNIHAAAGKADWYGNDFNPAQAAFAADLANITGAKVSDELFAEYCNRSDLPDFDLIVLHGIWSWVSDENRKHILSFIGRKLKPGGIVYVSYNTSPGWAMLTPIRELMFEFMRENPDGMVIEKHVSEAVGFVEKLVATDPLYVKLNPTLKKLINVIKSDRPEYLAHEYFNSHWESVPFSSVAAQMGEAKCEYACSADHLRHIDALEMSEEQAGIVRNISDSVLRETARNFLSYRQFRRDLFVKGVRKLSPTERLAQIRNLPVFMARNVEDVELNVKVRHGKVSISKELYMPLVEALGDHTVKKVGELEQIVSRKLSTGVFLELLMALCGTENVHVVQDKDITAEASPKTDALNREIIRMSRYSDNLATLASPVTGGGIGVSIVSQYFIEAISLGLKTPVELAAYVAETAEKTGKGIYKEGKELNNSGEADSALVKQAGRFLSREMPVLRRLGIV